MLNTPSIVGFVRLYEKVWERIPGGEWEDREMVLCESSRHGGAK